MQNPDELQPNLFNQIEPVKPYAGTSGWSGSDTSRERAETQDGNGVTAKRQIDVLNMLEDAGAAGLTWWQISDMTGDHHGAVSGALSVLHKNGHISRLTERRGKSQIYVCNQHVNGRATVTHKGNADNERLHTFLVDLLQHVENDRLLSAAAMIREAIRHGV